jgi:hypothetical protein
MSRRSRVTISAWAGSCLFILALVDFFGFHVGRERRVPPYLLGKWQTDVPRYKGASFEITGTSLVLGTVEGTVANYFISDLDVSVRGNSLEAVIYGRQVDEEKIRFVLLYESSNGGQLRIKNLGKIVWTRVENA